VAQVVSSSSSSNLRGIMQPADSLLNQKMEMLQKQASITLDSNQELTAFGQYVQGLSSALARQQPSMISEPNRQISNLPKRNSDKKES
jgi:hypothetical protein